MGLDGGSFITRTDVVKTKTKKVKQDFRIVRGQNYFVCALTNTPLNNTPQTPPDQKVPVVADIKGNLFNKDLFIQQWIVPSNKAQIKLRFPHIRKPLEDLVNLKLTPNAVYKKPTVSLPHEGESGPWICPLEKNIEVNGIHHFSYLVPCGHVICESAVCNYFLDGMDVQVYRKTKRIIDFSSEAKNAHVCPLCDNVVNKIVQLVPEESEDDDSLEVTGPTKRPRSPSSLSTKKKLPLSSSSSSSTSSPSSSSSSSSSSPSTPASRPSISPSSSSSSSSSSLSQSSSFANPVIAATLKAVQRETEAQNKTSRNGGGRKGDDKGGGDRDGQDRNRIHDKRDSKAYRSLFSSSSKQGRLDMNTEFFSTIQFAKVEDEGND